MINPQQIAKQFALMDISTRATQLERQQNDIDTQTAALDSLESALNDFQSAVDALNSDTAGPIVNSATASNESATISANSQAMEGTYTFYVQALATAQQTSYNFQDGDIPASGTFTITMGEGENESVMDIDLAQADGDADGNVSVQELCDAINDSDDNPGVTATLVHTNGATTMMLTADETGAANSFSVSTSGVDPSSALVADIAAGQDISTAQDADIFLGTSPENGVEITSSSNTFDEIIPGVSLTFSETSETSGPVTFTVKNDTSATETNVQTFVDAYNTLVDTLDALTSSGGEATKAGPFAGDAGISSLERQIQDITHATYGGVSILDYGITLDSDGHLQIDSEQFDAAMADNPDGLTALFVGDDSMTAQLDDILETYLDSNDGIITQRQNNLADQQEKLSGEIEDLTQIYNSSYERYLEEYTATLTEISSMKMSMAAFA